MLINDIVFVPDIPECDTFPTTYFIYDKPINVTCTLSSYPPVTSIHWQWNNSNEVIMTKPINAELEKSFSQLTVNPIQSREDRALSCWAVNEMGSQTKPCGFTFKVARKSFTLTQDWPRLRAIRKSDPRNGIVIY